MRKATMLLVAMALMAALMTGTAAAKQGKGKGPALKTLDLHGTVSAIAEDGSSISVDFEKGNRAAREAAAAYEQANPGLPMVFLVNGETKIEVDGLEGASLTGVEVGDRVHVQSKVANDDIQFVARKVSVEHEEDSSDEVVTP